MTTRQTPDAVREALEQRAVQIITEERGAEWATPKIVRAMMRFRDEAALDSRAGDAGEGRAIADVAAERARQISVEGWSPDHDDQHTDRSLATAAACYTMFAAATDEARNTTDLPGSLASLGKPIRGWAAFLQIWPWDRRWWKPKSRRADLVRAGALIIAEIERLDRREASRG